MKLTAAISTIIKNKLNLFPRKNQSESLCKYISASPVSTLFTVAELNVNIAPPNIIGLNNNNVTSAAKKFMA